MINTITSADYQQKIQQGIVLIDVGASWCPDCRRIEPIMEQLAKDYADRVSFYKVDFDVSEDLKEELAIRRIPTLIFYKNGVEVGDRLVEPGSRGPIENALKALL
ncbi:thioredoxin family protein [Helicobacter felis]|uniref:Thioredoxin n=1 Tax=Helicobacter felis (strain ATCC 49179 / CCUG 28539 / NCTC 12436 / CS1) TaxID=936155 RepID=E7ACE0_HELFC|nr:thioredoxin family protein [Helicobacter felis]CBY83027.1 putative thioredoxin, TrxA [Helicobacter felis ATCC 49179]